MRRLVVAVAMLSVMAATMMLGVPQSPVGGGPSAVEMGISTANAQPVIGGPDYCGPWRYAWYVSQSGYWYMWVWRWCHNPSIPPPGWYVDWAGWWWGGYAGPGIGPGYQSGGPY